MTLPQGPSGAPDTEPLFWKAVLGFWSPYPCGVSRTHSQGLIWPRWEPGAASETEVWGGINERFHSQDTPKCRHSNTGPGGPKTLLWARAWATEHGPRDSNQNCQSWNSNQHTDNTHTHRQHTDNMQQHSGSTQYDVAYQEVDGLDHIQEHLILPVLDPF